MVHIGGMEKAQPAHERQPESDAERKSRLAREAALIAKADTDVAAGRVVDFADVEAWVESWGTADELPSPKPRS